MSKTVLYECRLCYLNYIDLVFYLNIGTNLGDREANLTTAIDKIETELGMKCRQSSEVRSEPWGFDSDNKFVNIGVAVSSKISPEEMLVKLKGIEETMGSASHRNADGSYCDRLIDIDIMAVDELCIDETNLKIPHPHLQERTFFLEPLAELAPEWEHPLLHQTVKDLLKIVKNEE